MTLIIIIAAATVMGIYLEHQNLK